MTTAMKFSCRVGKQRVVRLAMLVALFLFVLIAGAGLFFNPQKFLGLDTEARNVSLPRECLREEDRSKRISCVIDTLTGPIKQYGVRAYLDLLEREFLTDDSASAGGITACHDIAHGIASAGVEALGDVTSVLASCTELCTFGCYHGAVERYVARGGDIAHNISTLCLGASPKNRPACFHGLGHGVAELSGYDLKKSFALCDRLSAQDASRDCGFGVFMEAFEPSTFGRASLPIPENLPAFCASFYGVYAEACFRNSGGYEFARSRDVSRAFAVCAAAHPDSRWPCAVGFGQNIYFSFQGKSSEILSICALGIGEQRQACLHGALMSSVVSDPLARHGFELCASVEAGEKADCYTFLGGHIRAVHDLTTQQKLCASLEEGDRKFCESMVQ